MISSMNNEQIKNIFAKQNLPIPTNIEKVAVGFTNAVYSIDDEYILKVCEDTSNERDFGREAILYKFFKGDLPVPEVIVFDNTKAIIGSHYLIYKKIQGDNLYNVWHTFTLEQRRSVTKQLCDILRAINETDIDAVPEAANLEHIPSWKEHILAKINKYLHIVEQANTITHEQAQKIREYVDKHNSALDEQKLALVYWDAHFDNVLVAGDKIVGLIDFERTEVASIDFALDIVKRMVEQPKKYMSEYAEQFAKDEDYKDLLNWYKEFYPELFEFENIDTRLNLYAIEHNLEDLEGWPEVDSLIDNTMHIVE
jgi:aminoglycoside phosphotransferase (APT) family kinase protein